MNEPDEPLAEWLETWDNGIIMEPRTAWWAKAAMVAIILLVAVYVIVTLP